jgi:hypothetical protein
MDLGGATHRSLRSVPVEPSSLGERIFLSKTKIRTEKIRTEMMIIASDAGGRPSRCGDGKRG